MTMRRQLLLGAAAVAVVAPSRAADAKPARIGWLKIQDRKHTPNHLVAFVDGMRALGHAEGRDFVVEARYADGVGARLPALAEELVRAEVDVILATSQSAVDVSRRITRTIPIVGRMTDDPVESGAAQSLARPGGNVTGVYSLLEGMSDKRLALLQEAVPGLRRVGALMMLDRGATASWLAETEKAARQLGLQVHVMNLRSEADLDAAFALAASLGVNGVIALRNPTVVTHYRRVIDLAVRHRMPEIFDAREFVEAGGYMSCGPNLEDIFCRLAGFVDRILTGVKPRDLPIEQPARFELVFNAATARAIGVPIPQGLLLRADEVIQ